MKFMHLSEARLGLHCESGRPWEQQRKEEIQGTLKQVVVAAQDNQVDIVMIAGGLFSHRPVTAELEEVNRLFSACPGTAFVIIAGNSDMVRSNSPILSFQWAPNVHYVTSADTEKICLPNLSAVIYAASVTEETEERDQLIAGGGQGEDGEASVRIALAYEPSFETASAFDCSGFSYVALGGMPSYTEVVKDKAYYCGGLEPEGMTDVGRHGYIRGEISQATGALLSCEFVPVASASYVPLLVKVGISVTPQRFSDMVRKEIERRGANNIYRIRISGQKRPEYKFDLEDLKKQYRIADVIDEAEPQYDFEGLFEQHQQDMIGYFISTLRRKGTDLPDIDKKAMFQGIDALIQTSQEEERA